MPYKYYGGYNESGDYVQDMSPSALAAMMNANTTPATQQSVAPTTQTPQQPQQKQDSGGSTTADPWGVKKQGIGAGNIHDYQYDPFNPTLAANNAMMASGYGYSAANPFSAFLRKRLASAMPMYVAQAALGEAGSNSQGLEDWLRGAISNGVPTGSADFLGRANAAFQQYQAMVAGDKDAKMTSPGLAMLGAYLGGERGPSNQMALYALNSGFAPALQGLLASAFNDIYSGYEMQAPHLRMSSRPNMPASFLDWALGSTSRG